MRWSNTLSFVVSSIGAAVGLGSLWFLPYQVYANGGAIFFLCFALSTLSVGVGALYIEVYLGTQMQQSLYQGLPKLSETWGRKISVFFYVTLFCILSFYSVISSQALFSLIAQGASLLGLGLNPFSWRSLIEPLEGSLFLSISILSLFWFLLFLVMSKSIQQGIEKYSYWLMLILVVTLLILITNSAYGGFLQKGAGYIFNAHWSDFNLSSLFAAFGASLFGLAVGAGCMMTYGSYLKSSTHREVLFQVFIIAFACLLISVLSCLALFPYVFHLGLEFTSGPKLVFELLPVVFDSLGSIGPYLGFFYLSALFSAGFTSCFSLIEPFLLIGQEVFKQSRRAATLRVVLIFYFFSLLLVLDNFFAYAGLIDVVIFAVTQIFLPIGVVLTLLLYLVKDRGLLKS